MKVLILAISYKYSGFCVAGVNCDTLELVRLGKKNNDNLECGPLSIKELVDDKKILHVGDLIEINAKKMDNNGFQNENYEVLSGPKYLRTFNRNEFDEIYQQIYKSKYIFLDNSYVIGSDKISNLDHSLVFAKVKNLIVYGKDYRMDGYMRERTLASFEYNGIKYEGIRVTDSVICGRPSNYSKGRHFFESKEAFVMFSLPSDEWSRNKGFYKYLSGYARILDVDASSIFCVY